MLIILEGASTAGKSMVQKSLVKLLESEGIAFKKVDQTEGVPPRTFDDPSPDKSRKFVLGFLKSECAEKGSAIIVFDRFHISHASITNWTVEDFRLAEDEIAKYDPLLVMLKYDEDKFRERIEGAIEYRGNQWIEEINRRGKDLESSANWHVGTQRKLMGLFESSRLPKVVYDTTDSDFDGIAQEILNNYIKPKL